MEKWICKVCGYTHQGSEAPEICPKCGAPKSQFKKEGSGRGCAFSGVFFVMLPLAVILSLMSCRGATVDNTAVQSVDLNRYLGKWYEIARFDHRFERGMTHCTATYTLQNDGKLRIINRGMKGDRWKISEGKAKTTNEPGVLRVSFFGPFYSDYRILLLADDYSYALVGGSSDDYLWILSRSPLLDEKAHATIMQEARRRGYNTDHLIWVNHKGMH